MLNKYFVCSVFGFMIDKMSIFPFLLGFIAGIYTDTKLPILYIQQYIQK
jgi:hypothetical protein